MKKRVLVVSQEINPYLDYSNIGKMCCDLVKKLQLEEAELRILMPKFGNINERRHRLHEVVRLSGINIVLGDDDMPLIIKVASMPGIRIQVYFLDNDEFFKRKSDIRDEKGEFYKDNAERTVFFCKGAMEIVKKFAWPPDLIHCHGWMTSLVPLYVKTIYKKEPVFQKAKVIYSVYKNEFTESFNKNFNILAPMDILTDKEFDLYKKGDNYSLLTGAINYADAIVMGDEETDPKVQAFIKTKKKPVIAFNNMAEGYIDEYFDLYRKLLADKK
jgi:starch synthase